jgi:hypothetical protein
MSVNEKMTALADEIRELSGTTSQLSIDTMTDKVDEANAEINSQADLITQIKNVVDSLPEAGSGGGEISLQDKTVTPATNPQTVIADTGYNGLGSVTVNAIPSTYIQPSGTKTVTTNGTHDVKSYESVSVNVANTGEDVTAETNAYTEKITQLTTAVTALETELAGKASGGSGENVGTCPSLTINGPSSIILNDYILYRNGQCIHSNQISKDLPVTIENIDVGQQIILIMRSKASWELNIDSFTNVEMLLDHEGQSMYIFKCTSSSPAIINVSEDD